MTEAFRAFRAHHGADDNKVSCQVDRCVLSDLSPGEVVVRVAWSSVNYKDALAATGANRLIREFPRVPGIDLAGYVHESDVMPAGTPVIVTGYELGTGHDGGYAEYARVPADWVVPLPDGLDMRTAMLYGTAGFTVALCVERFEANDQRPEAGPIAVTGASGGVGGLAVAILAHKGYEVHAVTGKEKESDYLRSLGATEVWSPAELSSTDHRPLEKVRWAGAVDNVGGDLLTALISTTGDWGNIVSVGLAGGTDIRTTVMPFILRAVSVLGVSSSNCPAERRPGLWQRLAGDLMPAALAGVRQREITLEELPEVIADMLAGRHTGRTLVQIGPE